MPSLLNAIAMKLYNQGLVTSWWEGEVIAQGDLVKLYRDYYDGYQRMQLTTEMKAMLNISDERLQRYNANYCELIIGSMADRLTIDRFEASATTTKPGAKVMQMAQTADMNLLGQPAQDIPDPAGPSPMNAVGANMAQQWINDLLDSNRFDALQIDIREAVLRDGETYIMSHYDDDEGQICWAHELAYNGDVGMLVVYERGGDDIAAAVKIWYDSPQTQEQIQAGETDTSLYMRVNIYYPDRTEKYFSVDGMSLLALDMPIEELSTVRNGQAPGVPVVVFSNKNGVSELVNIIPLQDSLNSALVDLVMAGRLTAFSIVLAVNLSVPQGITPGMTITKNVTDASGNVLVPQSPEEASQLATWLNSARLERLEAGDLSQIIAGIELIINQIGVISSTPLPGQMGGDATSGEALKQRDVRLLGKLNRTQVQLGNSWEDAIWLAALQYKLFSGSTPPEIGHLDTRWKSAEMRNDTDVLALFKLLNDAGYERAALRALGQSGLASYSEADIDKMMAEKAKDVQGKMQSAFGNAPDFGGFNPPTISTTTRNPLQLTG